MSKFKTIEKLGLSVFGMDVIKAEDLEALLQSAQVVYGAKDEMSDSQRWFDKMSQGGRDTHSALLIAITPIKKKTKAEAALEFVEKFKSGMLSHVGYLEAEKEAIRILEMKDEGSHE